MKSIFIIALSACCFLASCGSGGPTGATVTPEDSIVFKDKNGNIISLADLNGYNGTVNYEVKDDIVVNPEAQQLHNESRELASAGKYDEAIEKLLAAMAIQPEWAYPPYDLAYTYQLQGDHENALKYYELTDSLKPDGFFTSKTAVWSYRAEDAGKFPKGTYNYYSNIEWAETEKEKTEIAYMILDTCPDYAPAWMELGKYLNDNQQRLAAMDSGLSKNPDSETKSVLLVNKAAVLNLMGKKDEAVELLGQMIFDPETSEANRLLAKAALKQLLAEGQ